MKKSFTLVCSIRLCLLLIGLLTTLASYAQLATYDESTEDFPTEANAKTYTLSFTAAQSPTYFLFKGRVGGGSGFVTSTDIEDAFKVVVPTGFKIVKAELRGVNGETSPSSVTLVFAAGNTGYIPFVLEPYSNGTGYNTGDLGAGTYTGKVSASSGVKATWEIAIYMEKICLAPDVPTVSATKTSVDAGEQTTLSITGGNLNEATNWKWYSGGCGGTLVGTGTSITVSPTVSTAYTVRGEGGCVVPGQCAYQYIKVKLPPGERAREVYDESTGFDFNRGITRLTYDLNREGTYTFKGTISSGGDDQDSYAIALSDKYMITSVKYVVSEVRSTRNAEVVFDSYGAAGYFPAVKFDKDFSSDQPGRFPVRGSSSTYAQYIGSEGTGDGNMNVKWSTVITVEIACTEPDVPTVAATKPVICVGDNTTLSIRSGNLNDATTWTWYSGSCGGTRVGTGTSITVNPTTSTTYYVRGEGGCATPGTCASQQITVNPLPVAYNVTGGGAYCAGGAGVAVGASGSQNGVSYQLLRGNSPVSTTVTGTGSALTFGNQTIAGTYTVQATNTTTGCTQTMSGSATVIINPLPAPPVIVTQSGRSYPGGVSSLTLSQNVGNVILTAGNCVGTITWAGGNSSTLAVSTFDTGVQTFTATCTNNTTGCVSPVASATVTVIPTTLSVLHRDGNGNVNTNTLQPFLLLQNDGKNPIPYSEITVRYWLTVENPAPLRYDINYAQLGSNKIRMQYVPVTTANPGATGYIEFSFDASAGSLGTMSNSGPIQDNINKQDYSSFNQGNDYSYARNGNFTPNVRITAYRNGVIFYGLEPGPVVPTQSVLAMLQNNTGANANAIEAVLQVTNDGNVPVNYGDLKVRYYFTQDNNQPLAANQIGYTALGSGNVTAQLVRINPPLANADTYLELSFSPGLGQLMPGASTGGITYQIRHSDYSGFNQSNDYSYLGTGGMTVNSRVVVFVAGKRAFGTEPVSGMRQGAEETGKLAVRVLGNPATGGSVSVSVQGAEGQPLRYELSDVSGHLVGERQVEQAGAVDQQLLPVGHQPAGLLLLRVSTPTQSQTVKVLHN